MQRRSNIGCRKKDRVAADIVGHNAVVSCQEEEGQEIHVEPVSRWQEVCSLVYTDQAHDLRLQDPIGLAESTTTTLIQTIQYNFKLSLNVYKIHTTLNIYTPQMIEILLSSCISILFIVSFSLPDSHTFLLLLVVDVIMW